jgi:hypothetical protein
MKLYEIETVSLAMECAIAFWIFLLIGRACRDEWRRR